MDSADHLRESMYAMAEEIDRLRAENAHLEKHVERLARELDYAEQQNELVRRNAIDDVMYRLGEVLKASLEEANR